MKKVLLVMGLIVVLIVGLIAINYVPSQQESGEDINDYLTKSTPETLFYNGHGKNLENYTTSEDDTKWSYMVNTYGFDHDSEDDKAIRDKIHEIERNLAFNEYHCMTIDDVERVIFPWHMTLEGQDMQTVAETFEIDDIQVAGYELVEIIGTYGYLEDEINFQESQTQVLDVDLSRFSPNGITLGNDDGHFVTIRLSRHSKSSCHTFYHENIEDYQLLSSDHLDWWIFDRKFGKSFISFGGNDNSQFDIIIYEHSNHKLGEAVKPFTSSWNEDLMAFKTFVDQLGDLHQLDNKRVHFIYRTSNGAKGSVYLNEMR